MVPAAVVRHRPSCDPPRFVVQPGWLPQSRSDGGAADAATLHVAHGKPRPDRRGEEVRRALHREPLRLPGRVAAPSRVRILHPPQRREHHESRAPFARGNGVVVLAHRALRSYSRTRPGTLRNRCNRRKRQRSPRSRQHRGRCSELLSHRRLQIRIIMPRRMKFPHSTTDGRRQRLSRTGSGLRTESLVGERWHRQRTGSLRRVRSHLRRWPWAAGK